MEGRIVGEKERYKGKKEREKGKKVRQREGKKENWAEYGEGRKERTGEKYL